MTLPKPRPDMMTMTEAFWHFGLVPKNSRWSWSAEREGILWAIAMTLIVAVLWVIPDSSYGATCSVNPCIIMIVPMEENPTEKAMRESGVSKII